MNIKKFEYITLFSFRNVPIFSHWTLTIALAITLILGISEFSLFLFGICLFGIFLLHELGHLLFANHYNSRVLSICLYPLHGSCEYEQPETEYENYMIAWGGFIAQLIISIPCIGIHFIGGSYFPWFVNIPLFMFGYMSLILGFINILPISGLDGDQCWRAIPLHFKFKKPKPAKNKIRVVK